MWVVRPQGVPSAPGRGGDPRPDLVPAVLFSSRPIDATSPSIVDIAPSVLRRLGIVPPASMDGRDLGLR